VVVSPAVVQGDAAPTSLVRALSRLWEVPGLDVIIIGRGGGSVEDLWAFNDERLARAIAACPVPVVSAVGHEVDVTICDLVADLRAATPSHAAELVVPDRGAAYQRMDEAARRLVRVVRRRILDERGRHEQASHRLGHAGQQLGRSARRRLDGLRRRLQTHEPTRVIAADRRRLQQLREQLGRAQVEQTEARRDRLRELAGRLSAAGKALPRTARMRLARAAGALDALSPLAVLSRGYALARDADGRAVVDAGALNVGDALHLTLARGEADVQVTATTPPHGDGDADA
jgi:exodeoxyribonuclease VII large subunit